MGSGWSPSCRLGPGWRLGSCRPLTAGLTRGHGPTEHGHAEQTMPSPAGCAAAVQEHGTGDGPSGTAILTCVAFSSGATSSASRSKQWSAAWRGSAPQVNRSRHLPASPPGIMPTQPMGGALTVQGALGSGGPGVSSSPAPESDSRKLAWQSRGCLPEREVAVPTALQGPLAARAARTPPPFGVPRPHPPPNNLLPGEQWEEEALDEFDRLTHCAEWKPLVAKISSYVQTGVSTWPKLYLYSTSSGRVSPGLARRSPHLRCVCSCSLFFPRDPDRRDSRGVGSANRPSGGMSVKRGDVRQASILALPPSLRRALPLRGNVTPCSLFLSET